MENITEKEKQNKPILIIDTNNIYGVKPCYCF